MSNGDKLIKGVLELEKIKRHNEKVDKETAIMLKEIDDIGERAIKHAHEYANDILKKFGL